MRHIKPRQSFEAYLYGQKLISIDEQPEPVAAPVTDVFSSDDDKFKQLVEYTRQFRHYQKLYFAKTKKGEFAKDEQHFMMKYQEKIDNLLKQISF
ncbi:hypothetical protein Q0590_08400 [Rhodocytophaga aerolata]|uniref:Uncharacterized protein n=1 Tax=Rhodocytophaga aerolata TaxID=455078 RepID=A0ABT8R2W0_9BACT|nr:hypothetical protein [Rhodocytophaga aerolata]MDO1446269.1 hypothetical protein [Rhodocytophaga aerolata]